MDRAIGASLAACLLASAFGLVSGASPAGAAPPPTVSTTSGAPGAEVEVTLADCVTDFDAEVLQFVQTRLLSGTAPTEVLAGGGTGLEGTATIVVPDWLDHTAPATIETACLALDIETGEIVVTEHDPVAFDVLPGVGPATQLLTFSRLSLLAGQAFRVDGAGCTLPGADYAGAEVYVGDDPTGRSFEELVGYGETEVTGADFAVEVPLTNGYADLDFGVDDEVPAVEDLEVIEVPTNIPPGPYTVVAYCVDEDDDDGKTLLYEPQVITVTGTAPIDELDLTVSADAEVVTLGGSSCTTGPVDAFLEGVSAEDLEGIFDAPASVAAAAARSTRSTGIGPLTIDQARATRPTFPGPAPGRVTPQGLDDEGFLEISVDPDELGAWVVRDEVGFDQGFVFGYAICGDPLDAGWYYDPQGVVVEDAVVPTTPTPTPTPTPPAVPTPVPAAPVPVAVTPTYAG